MKVTREHEFAGALAKKMRESHGYSRNRAYSDKFLGIGPFWERLQPHRHVRRGGRYRF